MRRTSRDNAVCFESLEQALAKSPETYGHIDLLCGGWPCQDNSIAGKRKGHAGEKSGLWSEYKRLVQLFLPRWIIAENVPGLLSVNEGKDFWQVISDLDQIGYCVAWRVLDSRFFGVAQRRKRVFIIGSLGNLGAGQILFEQESGGGDNREIEEVGAVGVCLSAGVNDKCDPTRETYVASTLRTQDNDMSEERNKNFIVSNTVIGRDGRTNHPVNQNTVAFTIGTDLRGQPYKLHTETLVAEAHSNGKGEIARVPRSLDSMRGVVIGNAVTVTVAEWLGRRIKEYESSHAPAGPNPQ